MELVTDIHEQIFDAPVCGKCGTRMWRDEKQQWFCPWCEKQNPESEHFKLPFRCMVCDDVLKSEEEKETGLCSGCSEFMGD